MKIAVLGAGAMGCLYGGSLAEQGNDVTFIDVDNRVVEAINNVGVNLTTNEKGQRIIKACASLAENISSEFDLLILFTKTVYSFKALSSISHILTPSITVLTMQNGIGNKEVIEEFVKEEQIIIGMTGFPAENKGFGISESHGDSFTAIVDANGTITDRTIKVGEGITKAGLNCKVSTDTMSYIWEKVSFNAAVNGLGVVLRLTVGGIGEYDSRQLAYAVAREGVEVADKLNIKISFDNVKSMLDHAFKNHYGHRTSMLQDFLAERETEVSFINGAIAKQGEKYGVPTPYNKILFELIDVLQKTYKERQVVD